MEGSGHRLIRGNEVLSSNLPGVAEEGLGSINVQRWNSAVRYEPSSNVAYRPRWRKVVAQIL